MEKTNKLAVLISDIHFNLNNLELASQSLIAALNKAKEFKVPLVVAGDLNDTKAIIRAEVANRIIQILEDSPVPIAILEGNHDKINEKGIGHGLNYLAPYAEIIDSTRSWKGLNFVPYKTSNEQFVKQINRHDGIVICHQGFKGAFMGDYIQDHSSVDVDAVKDFRVFSGHYHRHQTLGTVTYIGSPYTITFGEANDGLKGFISINSDGTFERYILDLRRHIIAEIPGNEANLQYARPEDLIWIKLKGIRSELDKITKADIAKQYNLDMNFRFDKICIEQDKLEEKSESNLSDAKIMDDIIDKLSDSDEHKHALKHTWRDLLE